MESILGDRAIGVHPAERTFMRAGGDLQGRRLIRLYKTETGVKEFDVQQIADWAIARGAELPKPKTAREVFAVQLADAARAEYR